jgi:hypothetical protein
MVGPCPRQELPGMIVSSIFVARGMLARHRGQTQLIECRRTVMENPRLLACPPRHRPRAPISVVVFCWRVRILRMESRRLGLPRLGAFPWWRSSSQTHRVRIAPLPELWTTGSPSPSPSWSSRRSPGFGKMVRVGLFSVAAGFLWSDWASVSGLLRLRDWRAGHRVVVSLRVDKTRCASVSRT